MKIFFIVPIFFFAQSILAQVTILENGNIVDKDTIPLFSYKNTGVVSYNVEERVVLLNGVVNEYTSYTIQMLLLNLDSLNNDTITFFIKSLGGSVIDGLGIYDTIKYINSPVKTHGIDVCASMAAVLLSSGRKGCRQANSNCLIMIHEPSVGETTDPVVNEISQKMLKKMSDAFYEILADNIGQNIEKIKHDCQKETWFTAVEALNNGYIDKVIQYKE